MVFQPSVVFCKEKVICLDWSANHAWFPYGMLHQADVGLKRLVITADFKLAKIFIITLFRSTQS